MSLSRLLHLQMSKVKMILAFMLLVYLAACSAIPTTTSSKQTKNADVYIGFEGLSAAFAKNAPPLQIFEEIEFPIMLRISNRGAYSIPKDNKGLLQIAGAVPTNLVSNLKLEADSKASPSAKNNEAFFEAEGKTPINAKGEEIIIVFTAKAGNLPSTQNEQKVQVGAILCYPYKTLLSATVCIDPDYAGLRAEKKACSARDLVYPNGQGAPIAITKIEQQISPDKGDPNKVKPRFIIYLEKKGKGAPISDKDGKFLENCRNPKIEEQKSLFNVAFVTAQMPRESGKIDLECNRDPKSADKFTGKAEFVDNKDTIRCTLSEGISKTRSAYAAPLKVEVAYGYTQTETAEFSIKKTQ